MHIERERREGDREILHNALSMLLLLKTQCDYDNVAAKHWGIMLSSRNPSVEMKDCLTAPTPTWEMENYFVNIKSNKNKKRLVLLGWYCSCWFIVWFFFFFFLLNIVTNKPKGKLRILIRGFGDPWLWEWNVIQFIACSLWHLQHFIGREI